MLHRKVVERDIIIEYEKDGCVRSDVVATRDDMLGMAQQAEYDQQGEARVEIKHTFSFGTSSSWFRVKMLPVSTKFILPRVRRRSSDILRARANTTGGI